MEVLSVIIGIVIGVYYAKKSIDEKKRKIDKIRNSKL